MTTARSTHVAMRVSLLALALLTPALAVKLEDWRKCSDSSFCRRLRSIPERVESNSLTSPYTAGQLSSEESGSWTLPIHSSLYPDIRFALQVDILDTNVARIRMDEIGSSTPFKRYNETAKWVLLETEPKLSTSAKVVSGESSSTISYGDGLSLEIQHTPLKITQLRDGKAEVVINERSLLHMEHFRIKSIESQEERTTFTDGSFESHDEGMFEERFKKWTDSKPKGRSQVVCKTHSFQVLKRYPWTLPSHKRNTFTVSPSTPHRCPSLIPLDRMPNTPTLCDSTTVTFSNTRQTRQWHSTGLSPCYMRTRNPLRLESSTWSARRHG